MCKLVAITALAALWGAIPADTDVIFDTLPRNDQANLSADAGQTWMTHALGGARQLDTIEVATRAAGAHGGSVYLAVYGNDASGGDAANWILGNLVALSVNTQDMSRNGVVNTFRFSLEPLLDNTRYLYAFVDAFTNGVATGVGVRLNTGTSEARAYDAGGLAFAGGNHTIASRIVTTSGLKLARGFDDHMVLQRGTNVPVWGTAPTGSAVTVTFDGQVLDTVSDRDGDWSVALSPMVASTNGRDLVVSSATATNTLSDVLVGEVWVAAGQSNMRWPVSSSSNTPHPENHDLIRMCDWEGSVGTGGGTVYGAAEYAKLNPDDYFVGTWQTLDTSTVQAQSAVAYFFANALARELRGTGPDGIDVPIGVVELAVGGASTEAFIPLEALMSNRYLKAAFEDPRGVRTLGQWTTGRITKNLTGYTHSSTNAPHPHPYAPGFLYWTGMEHLAPFSFRGAIWYQGESNAEFTEPGYDWPGDVVSDYQAMVMTALVDSWRDAFSRPRMPFYMVQLPRINASNRTKWPWYREAQLRVADAREGVELAVVPEFGVNGSNVHPPNKEPVGERLALIARNRIYGEPVAYSGPRLVSHNTNGSRIVLSFENVGQGLISADGAPLRHFEIAGADRAFVNATATIVGDKVEVSAPSVSAPVAVRYAWVMNVDVNLYGSSAVADLPAAPFRTDDWSK